MDIFKSRRGDPNIETDPAKSLERLFTDSASRSAKPTPSPTSPTAVFATASLSATSDQPNMRSESIISEGFYFNGLVKAKNDLRVDGSFEGDVEVRVLAIGKSGSVSGQCRCDSLLIEGRFNGKAECAELHLSASAVVDGEVTYASINAQRGAQITGKYMQKKR
jgi:cytoskeletal protein CcmA (bactofilin family)